MAQAARRLRGLAYGLTDVETALRTAGRAAGADSVGLAARRIDSLPPEEFLDESRTALEAVLLGERDLPVETIGLILDVIASVDEVLREQCHG